MRAWTQSRVHVVPEMPASAWLLPGAASSPGSRDSCLLPGCREWAEAETEGTPLHLDVGQLFSAAHSQNYPTLLPHQG